MSIEITLFTNPFFIDELPQGLFGWLGWLFLCGVLALALWQGRGIRRQWSRLHWGIFIALLVLVPLTSWFLAIRLPAGGALPPPGKPVDPQGPVMLLLGALPWGLAAGLLGVLPAAGLAALAGFLLPLFGAHNLFTPLEMALLAVLWSLALHQRYRTLLFRLLRQPFFSALALACVYPLLFLWGAMSSVDGTLAVRLDYALTRGLPALLAVGGSLLVAGLFGQAAALTLRDLWGGNAPLKPSPAERRLSTRFLYRLAPLAVALVLTLMVGDWVVAGNAARELLRDRMASNAEMAAETVPFFLETGQSLIRQLAQDDRLYTNGPSLLVPLLQQQIRSAPFFSQLFLLDKNGDLLAGYPNADYARSNPSIDEQLGVERALNGVESQFYAVPPVSRDAMAQVTFLALVLDKSGNRRGVLIGRSELAFNPFMQPVIASLKDTAGDNGEGLLLDTEGRVLYRSNATRWPETYTGRAGAEALFYEDKSPDGTRRLVYYQPVRGHPWAVVLALPASEAQQVALTIAAPLLVMLVLLFVAAAALLRLGLRSVTGSLQSLAVEANRIGSGQLDHPLLAGGEDEVGQLSRVFEQMRVSLKSRLEELNRLLLASQGVASSLEIEESICPVLESALATGACAVRVVLEPAVVPEEESDSLSPRHFGAGPSSELYQSLDDQVLALTRQQERLALTNLARVRLFNFPAGMPRPEALLALALRHENLYYGALWLAFDVPHQFSDDEMRFLVTLAGHAALAATNARLFLSAEIGRQRLAAILASTPDPVLVTDHRDRLLLANPAAWQVVGLGAEKGQGQPIEKVTTHADLIRLLRSSADQKQSAEIPSGDGRVYLATASTVMAEGRRMGRVCVMRDVTHFKEVDALKSEFVSTVSHDLRSPLTLMRGYATMLEMVGNLNEQQTGYVRKIVTSVETMSRLVNNLLDLGRIEAGVDLQLETVPVNDILDRVVGALQLQAQQKRIQLSAEIPPHTMPLVEADQALLQQAVYNLVENAIKYTEPGGKVGVHVDARDNRMVFQISDTGIGIAPVDLSRLFEKFYRGAQREARKQVGSGLGLAIVKSIAERHGGEVWVESQLGKGSTFYLSVPLKHAPREKQGGKQ